MRGPRRRVLFLLAPLLATLVGGPHLPAVAEQPGLVYSGVGAYASQETGQINPVVVSPPAPGTQADPEESQNVAARDQRPFTPPPPPITAQGVAGPVETSSLTIGAAGEGFSFTGRTPPDPTLAAGPTRLVLAVNSSIGSYFKTPAQEWSITFRQWIEPALGITGLVYFDPWVLYDQTTSSNRFLVSMVAVDNPENPLKSFVIFGRSGSSDPNSTWCFYPLAFPPQVLPDYPKLGVSANSLFVTTNDFRGDTFLESSLSVIPKAPLLSCLPASFTRFVGLANQDLSLAFTVQPLIRNAPDEPYYLVSAHAEAALYPSGTKLTVWKVNAGTVLTRATVLVSYYTAPAFAEAPPTPPFNTPNVLDADDARLHDAVMSSGTIWTTHATAIDASNPRSEVRIYGINPVSGGVLTRNYQGPAGVWQFNPFVMLDGLGNGVVTFTKSTKSVSTDPSMWAAQRVGGAWLSPGLVRNSSAPYEDFRWGDYAGAWPDQGTLGMWIYNEYVRQLNQWGTYIARIDF